MIGRRVAAGLVGVIALLLLPTPAQAHPLGNFTTNQYDGLRVSAAGVDVDYVLDLAELPAYQAKNDDIDANSDGDLSTAERTAWSAKTCTAVAAATSVAVNGEQLALTSRAGSLSFPPGAGGLTTLRQECVLHAGARIPSDATISFVNGMFADRIGWRETTAVGDRYTLTASTVPATSVSKLLTAYPKGTAGSDVRTAALTVRPGGPAAAPAPFFAGNGNQARDVDRFTTWFTDLVGRPQLTIGVGLLAFLIALVLGGAHAVAPGHGKTIMAAYLVGSRGRLGQALTVAGTVAATHTAGVLVLGVLLATSLQLAPDTMYIWLRLASGVVVAIVGAHLLRKAIRKLRTHHPLPPEALPHEHPHDHGDGPHTHGPTPTEHHHPLSTDHSPEPALAVHSHHQDSPDLLPAGHTHDPHQHQPVPGGHPHSSQQPADDHDVRELVPAGHSHDHADDSHPRELVAVGHTHSHDADSTERAPGGESPDHLSSAAPITHSHDHGPDHDHDHDHSHDNDRELVAVGRADVAAHGHGHSAGHLEEHTHTHGGRAHTHHIPSPDEPLSLRTLLAMGFAGGLSPSPSAVVVLLGAAALGRAWYGVLLVLAYGIGLAATLIGIGFALARWGERLRRTRSTRWSRLLTHRLPAATATVILVVGVGMVAIATAELFGV